MRYYFLVLVAILSLNSCKKDAGEGGTSTIAGTVIEVEYNKYTSEIVRWHNAYEEDVYIIYGGNNYYGDRVKTDKTGRYEFKNLTKGDYTIYVYSDDLDNLGLKTTRGVDVSIGSNHSTIAASNISIAKTIEKGNAKISGKLFALDYDASLTVLKDSFYLADEYVYLAIKGDSTYFDRVKTFYDGSYVFSELLPGKYEVYAYSKANTASGITAIKVDVEITDFNQEINLPRIEVIK